MQIKQEIRQRLALCGIENAEAEARMLCEAFSGEALEKAVEKRCTHYPLQYILGVWGFWREEYEVSEHCLVPRPDTEHLVEKAVALLPGGARFLDLCTGSGCVAISTLASRKDTTAVAVDLFRPTLELAGRNAKRNGVSERLELVRGDVLAGPCVCGPFDAILSNPPYIPDAIVPTLASEVRHEPAAALCGGADGLDFYRAILEGWSSLLAPGGFILFEIGYDQADALRALAKEHGRCTEVFRDFGGNDRVVLLH